MIEPKSQTIPAPILSEWINADVTIEEPQGDSVSVIPFHLWPAQRDALVTIQREPQVIILKARQLGISWLCIAYALWLCLFHANKLVMVFSKDQDSANEMIRRARGIYQRLQRKPVALTVDNVTTIGFANGSRIKSFAATEDAGSSFTASLIIIDEFAKMRYADELYTSVKPTVADGGQMIIVSTARGEGNAFHKLWDAATKHLNSLTTIFLPWHARPDRTAEWYAAEERNAISSAHHRQEYPAEPSEAFQSIGEDRFLPSMILWDQNKDDLPPLAAHEPMVLIADAANVNDSFGLLGITKHPNRSGCLAIRYAQEWKPPLNGLIDHYAEGGPDWMIRKLCKDYAVVQLSFDPTELRQLTSKLMQDGIIQCVEFPQTAQRLEADKMLFDFIVSRQLWHDGNPALRAHIDNADKKPDPESRKIRIVHRTGPQKIDLAVCAAMGVWTADFLQMAAA